MTEGGAGATAEDLDAIEREIAACREVLRDLEARARVMEVEAESWKPPSESRDLRTAGAMAGSFIGFFTGLVGGSALFS